jgi:hypothetical protein
MIPAKSYGSLNDQNQWTGLIGQISRNEVDFCVMDLTILFSRTQVKFLIRFNFKALI